MALLARRFFQPRRNRRQIVTIDARLVGLIDVHRMVEVTAEALDLALANGRVALEAVGRGLIVMAGSAARQAEADDLVLGPLFVRPMAGLALQFGGDDVRCMGERASEELPALILDPFVALQAWRGVRRLLPW